MSSILSDERFHNEDAAFAFVEAKLWPFGPVCHHCGETNRIGKLKGKSTRPGLYKCYACRKPFTVRMGTVLESSHVPLRVWLQAFYLMASSKKGIATRQLQRTFGGSMRTAWFLGHRIREAMKKLPADFAGPLGGAGEIVEADETWIGGKAENRAFAPIPNKIPVFSLVERGGEVRSFHVPRVTATNLAPIIARHVHRDTRFMSDESPVYAHPGRWQATHETVNHSAKEYVRDDVTTNSVEGFFSILKRGVYGCYFHVSEAHLNRYLAEFDFRFNHRVKLGFDDVTRANLALVGAAHLPNSWWKAATAGIRLNRDVTMHGGNLRSSLIRGNWIFFGIKGCSISNGRPRTKSLIP
jgi:transposase-like protein